MWRPLSRRRGLRGLALFAVVTGNEGGTAGRARPLCGTGFLVPPGPIRVGRPAGSGRTWPVRRVRIETTSDEGERDRTVLRRVDGGDGFDGSRVRAARRSPHHCAIGARTRTLARPASPAAYLTFGSAAPHSDTQAVLPKGAARAATAAAVQMEQPMSPSPALRSHRAPVQQVQKERFAVPSSRDGWVAERR